MLKFKKILLVIVCLLVLLIGLFFLDKQTTYIIALNQNNVEVLNDDIIIEMSSGTSMGYFKKAELEEMEEGIYRIEAYFSLLTGEYSGYKYTIDNSDKHIREIRQYSLDGSDNYTVIYQNKN